MPIYEYRCPECRNLQESFKSISKYNDPEVCEKCGSLSSRIVSLPGLSVIPLTGKDKVLKTLNKEDGRRLPTNPSDMPRLESALSKGLNHDGQPGKYRSGVSASSRGS